MLKLRTGNHNLAVESYRYRRKRKEFNERTCDLCSINKIQDLHHILIECPHFQDKRNLKLEFLIKGSKHDLYNQLNSLSRGQIKAIADFMEIVEKDIKLETTRN